MTNLYKFTTNYGTTYCFANTPREAEAIVLREVYENRLMYNHTVELASENTLKEDGVSFLSENDFVGIPQQKFFMLNGSNSHNYEHYFQKNRTATAWWSEKVPGSENVWSKTSV